MSDIEDYANDDDYDDAYFYVEEASEMAVRNSDDQCPLNTAAVKLDSITNDINA